MANLYEGMFLLDNQVVRENWKTAKAIVADTLTKHGAKVQTIRRWDERRLSYSIHTKRRATYFLAYYEMDGQAIPLLRRDLDLSEQVMRYLMLSRESVPEEEFELAKAESADDFVVPDPPSDDAPDENEPLERLAERPEHDDEYGGGRRREPRAAEGSSEAPKAEAPKAEATTSEAPKAEATTSEAPKAEATTSEAPKAEATTNEAPTSEATVSEEGK